jgi:hypothetical protein
MNDQPTILERRAAALLEMRFRALARAGKPIAGAYTPTVPQPRIVWTRPMNFVKWI